MGKKIIVANEITRRTVLRHGMHLSLGGASLLALAACGESTDRQAVCTEPGQLSDSESSMRTSLGYVDVSPNSGEACGGCEYFSGERTSASCGSCQLLPGQVSSEGLCNSWITKS